MTRARARARLLRMRARRGWRRIRPRSRRSVAVLAVLAGGIALALLGAARLGPPIIAEYAFRPEANAATWRSQIPTYGDVAMCARCHEPQYARLTTATHAGIGCESCHGPLGQHALASPGTPEAVVTATVPTDQVCVSCHVPVTGRPAFVRQVVPTDHYVATCLACHDPHTGISNRPPVVEHTLDNLPPCITCHGAEGFKARNQRHPVVDSDDPTCLACHLPGRGPLPTGPLPSDQRTGSR